MLQIPCCFSSRSLHNKHKKPAVSAGFLCFTASLVDRYGSVKDDSRVCLEKQEIKCIAFFTGRVDPMGIRVTTDKACLIAASAVDSVAVETDPAAAPPGLRPCSILVRYDDRASVCSLGCDIVKFKTNCFQISLDIAVSAIQFATGGTCVSADILYLCRSKLGFVVETIVSCIVEFDITCWNVGISLTSVKPFLFL